LSTTDKIPIKVIVEDVGDVDALRLATAEVSNELYPNRFDVKDSAGLVLYVTGTTVDYPSQAQNVGVRISFLTAMPVAAGTKTKTIWADYVFASNGGLVQGGEAYRNQYSKQVIFKTAGEFLKLLE
jgi:hypothetical protein